MRPSDRLLMWGARIVWALLPVVAAPSISAGLETRSDPVRVVVLLGLWAGWAVVLGSMFFLHTVTLTIVRIVVPAAVVVVTVIGIEGGFDLGDGLALATAIASTALCFLPGVGAVFLGGVAYGDEVRVALRAPGVLLLGPIELAWIVLVAAAVTGPLLLAARQWIIGAIVTLVGVPVVVVLARALHGLARRWLVFVPAGVVVHDPLGLTEPVLLLRAQVRSFGPAAGDTTATDLTMASPGLAIEVALAEKVDFVRRRGRSETAPVVTTAVLVTPTRPGVAVAIATERRVGKPNGIRGDRSPSP